MAKGWEVSLRVQENFLGFGSTVGDGDREGFYLFADSETLGRNMSVKERDGKLIPMRLSPVQTASVEQEDPGGEIVFQPRTDDCAQMMMAFFQQATYMMGEAATAYGGTGGTWVFTPIDKSLAWTGSLFGTTDIYPLNVVKYYGEGMTDGTDAIRFERGIVSRLVLEQAPAEDLQMTAELRFLQASDGLVLGTGYKSAPNVTGSYSEKKQLVDWNATMSVGGSEYAIERIRFEFDNSITERRKLGQRGFYQFPFGRAMFSGEFELEYEDMSLFTQGTTGGTIACRWQTEDGDWMEVFCPNVFYRASEINVSDTGPVMRPVSFRAYPTAFGGSNAAVVSLYANHGTDGPPAAAQLVFG